MKRYSGNGNLIPPRKATETIIFRDSTKEVRKITDKYIFAKKEIKSSTASYNKKAALKLCN